LLGLSVVRPEDYMSRLRAGGLQIRPGFAE